MARRKGRPTRDDAEPRPAPGDPRGEDFDPDDWVGVLSPAQIFRAIDIIRDGIADESWVELDDTYEGLRFPPSAGS